MSTGVIITTIICGSVVLLSLLRFIERQQKRKAGENAGKVIGEAFGKFADKLNEDD